MVVANGGSSFRDWLGRGVNYINVLYHDRSLSNTDVHICQNSENVYLEFVHFPVYELDNF